MSKSWVKQALVALALPVLLAACQSDGSMSAMAPATSLRGPAAPLAFVAIQGPSADVAQKFEAILAQEARKRGFDVVAANSTGNALRVKTYLDAFQGADGKTGFSWVLDTSENGRTRSGRVRGAASLGSASATPWSAFDEAAMRQVAQMSVNDLVRLASGAPTSEALAAAAPQEGDAQ